MKKLILVIISLFFLFNSGLIAKEWSAAEKEVVKAMEESYELWAKKDVEGFLSYVHDDYIGWHYESPVTQTKSSFINMVSHYFPKTKVIFWEMKPLDIQILDDIAIVHYYFYFLMTDEEGKENSSQSRYTDILMKTDEKWLLISDHGGDVEVKQSD
jgi:uncharacterized protein (TIGR02246 family)